VPAPDVSRSPRPSTGSSVRAIRTRFVKFASRIGVVPGTITAGSEAFARHSCPGSGHSLAPLRVQPARSKEALFRPVTGSRRRRLRRRCHAVPGAAIPV
jgi:hypothetical protein